MATCLLALGSNLGDRERTLHTAIDDLNALSGTKVVRFSRFYPSAAIGGPSPQPDFLNAAAVVETRLEPTAFLELLLRIESRHGRQRTEQSAGFGEAPARWAARTLDLDLLLFEDRVIDTPTLTVPHPRMSFRRFVVTPAAEIAAEMVHPTIGWTIGRLAAHLDAAGDRIAVLSPREAARAELAATLTSQYGAQVVEEPHGSGEFDPLPSGEIDRLWPRQLTSWLKFPIPGQRAERARLRQPSESRQVVADVPKLSILLGAEPCALPADEVDWPLVVAQHGRGPTLIVTATDWEAVIWEVKAAIASVWPDLGLEDSQRIE